MKEIQIIKEKVTSNKRTVSVRVRESVLNFIDHNGEEWNRDRSKQINFILSQYAAGNFEILENCYNGIGKPKKKA